MTPVASLPALDAGYTFECLHALGTTGSYLFSRTCYRFHLFPCLEPVTSLSALGAGYALLFACRRSQVFARLPPLRCFPTLRCRLHVFRAMHRSNVFERVKNFPAFRTGYTFSRILFCTFPPLCAGCIISRAWHPLHGLLRLRPITCFPVLGDGHMFPGASHRLHVFSRLVLVKSFPTLDMTPVTCFPALGTGSTFFLRLVLDHVPGVETSMFPRASVMVTCFPAFAAGNVFYSAWHRLPGFPRFSPFSARCTLLH